MMRALACLGLLLLSACASSPESRFYTLDTRPSPEPPHELRGKPVVLTEVQLPPELDRRAMVHATGTQEIEIREFERWSGPLDLMIRRTLTLDLAARMSEGAVVLPGQPAPAAGVRPVVVVIEEFAPGPADRVRLQARWFMSAGDEEIALSGRETIEVELAAATAASAAAAMSDALARLADRMADALASH